MLRIRIELIPFGTLPVKNSWEAHIWNDTTGSRQIGNYLFKIFRKNSTQTIWKGGEIKDFKREQWSVWYLLYLCLDKIYGE